MALHDTRRPPESLASLQTALLVIVAALLLGVAMAFLVVPTPGRAWLLGMIF